MGQKQSGSSYMACGVLHPVFGCPCMHLQSPTVSYYSGISDALYFLSQLPFPKQTLAMSAILSISTMLLVVILKTPTEKVPYSQKKISMFHKYF